MSTTRSEQFLELDSQTLLLNQIQDLTSNHSSIISITGSQGAGKTWLAERYLNTDYEIQTLSFLSCLRTQSLKQQRSILLGQLLSDSLMDGEDSLLESLQAYHDKDMPFYTCLIIDNAEQLAGRLLSELVELVSVADEVPEWRINVVMFSYPDALNEKFAEMASLDNVVHLSIKPLTQGDTVYFLDQLMANQAMNPKKAKKIKRAVTNLGEERYPGLLMGVLSKFTINKYTKVNKLLIIFISILLGLGVASWWVNYHSDKDAHANLDEGQQITSMSGGEKALREDEVKEPFEHIVITDDVTLPDPVTTEAQTLDDTSIAGQENQQRIVVSSDTIDALLEGNDPDIDNAKAINPKIDSPVAETTASDATLQNKIKNGADQTHEPITSLSLDTQSLLAVNSTRYTIQLSSFSQTKEAMAFINQYSLQGKVRVYRSVKSDKERFYVMYQDFESIQLAREAIRKLPTPLREELPWPKSIGQVQQEILAVK